MMSCPASCICPCFSPNENFFQLDHALIGMRAAEILEIGRMKSCHLGLMSSWAIPSREA